MKHIILAFAVLLSTTLLIVAQQSPTSTQSADIILKLEQQWEDALVKSDTGALEKLYADDLIYTHSSGKVDTKATYISAIKSGQTKYESMKRDDIQVHLYGSSAIVSCHWDVHIRSRGNKVDLDARYLHVWVQERDGWRLVAHQSTRITP